MDDLNLYASNGKSLESLIQTVHMFSNDIGINLDVEKCGVLTIKKGMIANSSDGIALPNKTKTKGVKRDTMGCKLIISLSKKS